MKRKLITIAVTAFFVSLLCAGLLFGQEAIPEDMQDVFAEGLLATASLLGVTVVSITQLIRNVLGGVKGWWAVAIAAVVSMVVAFVKYKEAGVLNALLLGVVTFFISAGGFKMTKYIGSGVKSVKP